MVVCNPAAVLFWVPSLGLGRVLVTYGLLCLCVVLCVFVGKECLQLCGVSHDRCTASSFAQWHKEPLNLQPDRSPRVTAWVKPLVRTHRRPGASQPAHIPPHAPQLQLRKSRCQCPVYAHHPMHQVRTYMTVLLSGVHVWRECTHIIFT